MFARLPSKATFKRFNHKLYRRFLKALKYSKTSSQASKQKWCVYLCLTSMKFAENAWAALAVEVASEAFGVVPVPFASPVSTPRRMSQSLGGLLESVQNTFQSSEIWLVWFTWMNCVVFVNAKDAVRNDKWTPSRTTVVMSGVLL